MRKRTLTIHDIPDTPQKLSNEEKVLSSLKKGKKTFTQIKDDINIRSIGNLNNIIHNLINGKRVKKSKCKCCNAAELYELI